MNKLTFAEMNELLNKLIEKLKSYYKKRNWDFKIMDHPNNTNNNFTILYKIGDIKKYAGINFDETGTINFKIGYLWNKKVANAKITKMLYDIISNFIFEVAVKKEFKDE